jgi:hypothetical protein
MKTAIVTAAACFLWAQTRSEIDHVELLLLGEVSMDLLELS